MKERNYSLDLMRVFLCLCVITLHSFTYFGCEDHWTCVIVPTILIAADGLFYMLSGYFNLEKDLKSSTDIKNYYKSKFINILVPFLAFNLFWVVWDYVHTNTTFNLLEVLGTYYDTVMTTAQEGHMWFMYPLFGLLLSGPFFSKMLHNMNDKEVKILWYITIGFNIIQYYFCMDLGKSFRVVSWFMDGWAVYYIGGYYYRHIVSKENKWKWLVLGLLGFTFTILGNQGYLTFFTGFIGGTDIQPMFTIFCVAYLYLWDKVVKVKGKVATKVIGFLSKNTFMIYLYHMRGIEYILRKFSITEPSLGNGLIVVIGTFLVSLLAAYITNLCLKPVKKLLDKAIKVKEV